MKKNKKSIGGILVIALIFSTVGYFAVNYKPKNPSFKDLIEAKESYLYATEWFDNGTIISLSETDRITIFDNTTEMINFAIVVPLPFTKGEITENGYIIALIRTTLKVGDQVNMHGSVTKVELDGKKMYYLDSDEVKKIMVVNITDSDFQNILMTIKGQVDTAVSTFSQLMKYKDSHGITFAVCTNDKEKYLDKYSFFENGTIVFTNKTNDVNFVAICPISIPKQPTDDDYIIAKVPIPLEISDNINVRGTVKKAEHDGKTVYYLDASEVAKIGTTDVTDPDFQKLIEIIVSKEKDSSFLWFWYWYFWWSPWGPFSPLNPANPSNPWNEP
jgi:hypothetical protein